MATHALLPFFISVTYLEPHKPTFPGILAAGAKGVDDA
jgi:hypothetical protein